MRTTRRATWPLVALLLASCGDAEPTFKGLTAPQLAVRLWSPNSEEAAAAREGIQTLAASEPARVLAALEKALGEPPPPPPATPLVFAFDEERARALGLASAPLSEVVGNVMEVMKNRLHAQGLKGTFRGRGDGTMDVGVDGVRSRASAERLRAALGRRGALELRVVAPDPSAGPARGAARETVFEGGPALWAATLAEESERERSAREAGKPYVPKDPRWRAVPRTEAAGGGHLLVEEPAGDAEALDDRLAAGTRAFVDPEEGLVVAVKVHDGRRAAWRAFVERNAGLRMAVVVDGTALGTTPVPARAGDEVHLAVWRETTEAARAEAADLALTLSVGRLPWPVVGQPLPPRWGLDPEPENPVSLAFVAVGAPALPVLDRIAKEGKAEWTRASAEWAAGQIRAGERPRN
jgi:hypothetical protein